MKIRTNTVMEIAKKRRNQKQKHLSKELNKEFQRPHRRDKYNNICKNIKDGKNKETLPKDL